MFPFYILAQEQQYIIYFDTNADSLNEEYAPGLQKWISLNKDATITKVYGYADSKGKSDSNIDLSQRRAEHIYEILKDSSLTVTNAEVKGFGDSLSQSEFDGDRKVVVWYTKPPKVAAPKKEKKIIEPVRVPETVLTTEVAGSKKGDKLILSNLQFHGGTADLLPESKPLLDELVQIMKDNPSLKIDIQGHICCYKKDDALMTSTRRAKTVYYYLIKKGIDKKRLSCQGFAGKRPIYKIPEKNKEEQQANRRVEIEIIEN